jgi:hypothetical protein
VQLSKLEAGYLGGRPQRQLGLVFTSLISAHAEKSRNTILVTCLQ